MYILVKRSKKFLYHYVVKGENGETVLSSEVYFSKFNAQRAAYHASKTLKIRLGK